MTIICLEKIFHVFIGVFFKPTAFSASFALAKISERNICYIFTRTLEFHFSAVIFISVFHKNTIIDFEEFFDVFVFKFEFF